MPNTNKKVGIYTLGCKVNQYESEAISELFVANGFEISAPSKVCDVYVINTCTVTAESDRKARQFIRRAIKQNPNAYVLVTGCLSQTQPEQIASIAGVDFVCGNANKAAVVSAAIELIKEGKKRDVPLIRDDAPDQNGFEKMKITHFDRTRAYVKIEDGCENKCAYCIIPKARGSVRSKAPQDVIDEVRGLVAAGCREIVLTGIETASYGKDLYGYTLADLLCEVDRVEGLERVRLGSLDPSLIKPDFAKKIADLRSLAPHFHLSMQSGCDKILALMKRKYNTRMALDAMKRLRDIFPTVQFTTDMIVGFPGEHEEEFEETIAFIKEAKFLAIHVFPYSKRKGTVAERMADQIPEEVKHARVARLSAEAGAIREQLLESLNGSVQSVLFETYKDGVAYGHTASFVEVACPSPCSLQGRLLNVAISGHDETTCYGTLI